MVVFLNLWIQPISNIELHGKKKINKVDYLCLILL